MDVVTSADGTEIAFERSGSGPPLLLVHGNADVLGFWDLAGVRAALSEHCTVYAVERRGRGESGDAPDYELAREAEDLAALMESVGDPMTVLGHSGGAVYALEAALRTDKVDRLILNEPPIAVGDHELEVTEAVARMEQLLDQGKGEEVVLFFQEEIAGLTSEELEAARSSPAWEGMVDAAPVLPREIREIARYELEPGRFRDMTRPTLLMVGGESPPFSKDAVRALADALPDSRVEVIDGHSHEPMNTAPDRFVHEVLAFMERSTIERSTAPGAQPDLQPGQPKERQGREGREEKEAGGEPMDEIAQLHRSVFAAVEAKDPERVTEIYHPDAVYMTTDGDEHPAREVVPEIIRTFTGAFPDLRIEIRRQHLAGDGVSVIEYTFSGTHEGELEGIAPTGREMEVVACSVAEARDGWIVRERDYYDTMAMMSQLGLAEG